MQYRVKCREGGGAILEFLVVLPILLLFFIGLTELGRLFSSYVWVSQNTYLATLTGTEMHEDVGPEASRNTYEKLYQVQNKDLDGFSDQDVNVTYDLTDRTVRVEAKDSLIPLFGKLNLDYTESLGQLSLKVDYTGPILLANPEAFADTINSFSSSNNGCYYDCNFNKICGVPNTTECRAARIVDPGGAAASGCFRAATPILMADGTQKPIELIRPGDRVIAFDIGQGRNVDADVTEIMSFKRSGFYILNGYIQVTAEHPFYVNGEWIKVSELTLGSEFLSATGEKVKLLSKTYVNQSTTVYNFTVDGVHNYYAAGILVHNKSPNRRQW
ncbi:MAG: hypothetical protein D6719_06990 [Candidatus Dadabacteria bacterium]|nr:MAG: hypothetical protein D6719_06990 [Candidatus Dadabacteria bacterium]